MKETNEYMKIIYELNNKLPMEIVRIIMNYSIQPQSIKLRNDIISYYHTQNNISTIFLKRYTPIIPYSFYNHLVFHIHCYMNAINNIYNDCEDIFDNVLKRNFMLKDTNKSFNIQMNPRNKYEFIFRSRVYWGLLTPEERNKFICIQNNMDLHRSP
jgi:hypothetical protein